MVSVHASPALFVVGLFCCGLRDKRGRPQSDSDTFGIVGAVGCKLCTMRQTLPHHPCRLRTLHLRCMSVVVFLCHARTRSSSSTEATPNVAGTCARKSFARGLAPIRRNFEGATSEFGSASMVNLSSSLHCASWTRNFQKCRKGLLGHSSANMSPLPAAVSSEIQAGGGARATRASGSVLYPARKEPLPCPACCNGRGHVGEIHPRAGRKGLLRYRDKCFATHAARTAAGAVL